MKHFAFTDIHGAEKLYDKVIEEIKKRSGEEEYHIYFLGDAADRGAKGYKIIKKLLDDPNITYIYGNHEDMFVKAACEIKRIAAGNNMTTHELFQECIATNQIIENHDIELCLWNGGLPTIREWAKDSSSRQNWIIDKLWNLPRYASYKNYDMCHAGCFKEYWKKSEYDMIWSRDHFDEEWFVGRTLVHGHTPTSGSNRMYAKCTKINLDSDAYRSGVSKVLDMDAKEIFSVLV